MQETLRYLIGKAGPSGFGSKSSAEDVTACISLKNITAIVTGATSGIGLETARVLAKRGARIIIPARNVKLGQEIKGRLKKESPDAEIIVMALDLSSFASVRSFASRFLSMGLPLHILINNAGRFCQQFELSENGFEASFATNYLGHFLLTKLLLNKMIETANETQIQGRIINVSSAIHTWIPRNEAKFGAISDPKRFNGTKAYALSKLANILHAKELASRLKKMKANVTANAVHPGVVRTGITRGYNAFITDSIFLLISKLLKTLPQAASTNCYVAVHPSVEGISGQYFVDCNESSCSPVANDPALAAQLWRETEAMLR
eukprot:TRINITY_DN1665_c0_g1_i1.p1 TRINITY_DN1665_c0_g1~~TRINITY_DN1665_c0_g1_i1.p1  ORF type:complete len:320 (-),score=12.64 TRINITY_DN1665_c0_g1_i1:237-1196(-)